VDKWDLHMLHWTAWEKGIKSLYYCRSKSVQRAQIAGSTQKGEDVVDMAGSAPTNYDECLACQ
jgi:ribonucleoside-diphosphate reductase alpha chain